MIHTSPLRGENQGEGEKRWEEHSPSPQSSPSEGRGRLRFATFIEGTERDLIPEPEAGCLKPARSAWRFAPWRDES